MFKSLTPILFFLQRDFYYDTLRAIENGLNTRIAETPSLGQTQTAIDLVCILKQTEL